MLETKKPFKTRCLRQSNKGRNGYEQNSSKKYEAKGFVKEAAAGTAAVAVGGAFAVEAAPVSHAGKEGGPLEARLEALEKRLQHSVIKVTGYSITELRKNIFYKSTPQGRRKRRGTL